MDPVKETQKVLAAPGFEWLARMGVPLSLGRNPRLARVMDTQQIQNDDAFVNFFNTATSTRGTNPFGWAGASLRTQGQLDDNTVFVPLFLGMTIVGDYALTDAQQQDAERIYQHGIVREIKINEQQVRGGRELPVHWLGTRRAVVPMLNGSGAAANATAVALGDPSIPGQHGWRIPKFLGNEGSRIGLAGPWKGGSPIVAEVGQKSAGNLSAATYLELAFFGVEFDT